MINKCIDDACDSSQENEPGKLEVTTFILSYLTTNYLYILNKRRSKPKTHLKTRFEPLLNPTHLATSCAKQVYLVHIWKVFYLIYTRKSESKFRSLLRCTGHVYRSPFFASKWGIIRWCRAQFIKGGPIYITIGIFVFFGSKAFPKKPTRTFLQKFTMVSSRKSKA